MPVLHRASLNNLFQTQESVVLHIDPQPLGVMLIADGFQEFVQWNFPQSIAINAKAHYDASGTCVCSFLFSLVPWLSSAHPSTKSEAENFLACRGN
jgi:hypothetical protein